jgi:hypothetical protein
VREAAQALAAAYTPLLISPDGKRYTQNDRHLFADGHERSIPKKKKADGCPPAQDRMGDVSA